jgi:hypothetical protein
MALRNGLQLSGVCRQRRAKEAHRRNVSARRDLVFRGCRRKTMYRKILLIIAALVGSAALFAPTGASARGWGRGRGFGWGGAAIGLGLGLGIGAGLYRGGYGYGGYGYPAYGYGYPAYGYPAYGYGYRGGCWRRAVVRTPYGPRTRRVWVCG